jgi:hypothetical protein
MAYILLSLNSNLKFKCILAGKTAIKATKITSLDNRHG